MKKFLVCFIGLIFLSCAPVYEIYLNPGDMGKLQGKKIVSVDTTKTGSDILIHVKYKE